MHSSWVVDFSGDDTAKNSDISYWQSLTIDETKRELRDIWWPTRPSSRTFRGDGCSSLNKSGQTRVTLEHLATILNGILIVSAGAWWRGLLIMLDMTR